MLMALFSAFALKPETSARFTPQIQTLFAPIAGPARNIGRMIEKRLSKPAAVDPRSTQALSAENEQLRVLTTSLAAQLDQLILLNRDRDLLGDVRKQSVPYAVIANDAGTRESLSLGGSTLEGLQVGQPVIFLGGIAGRIVQAGVAGVKVQLITDVGAKPMTGTFGRFQTGANGEPEFLHLKLATTSVVLVEGAGNNTLVVNKLTLKDAEMIHPGDWMVLADNAWPANLQGYKIGQVKSKVPLPASPLFAKITIEPSTDLKGLKDVNVVVKTLPSAN